MEQNSGDGQQSGTSESSSRVWGKGRSESDFKLINILAYVTLFTLPETGSRTSHRRGARGCEGGIGPISLEDTGFPGILNTSPSSRIFPRVPRTHTCIPLTASFGTLRTVTMRKRTAGQRSLDYMVLPTAEELVEELKKKRKKMRGEGLGTS